MGRISKRGREGIDGGTRQENPSRFQHSPDLIHQLHEWKPPGWRVYDARQVLDKVARGDVVEKTIWKGNGLGRQVGVFNIPPCIGPDIDAEHTLGAKWIAGFGPAADIERR